MNYVKFSFIVLFLFTSVSLISCSAKSKKYEQEDTQEWYIGKLKPEFPKYELYIYTGPNDSTLFTLLPDQKFLYILKKEYAYLINGMTIGIPENYVMKIDTSYFKFEYTRENLLSRNYWYELDKCAEIWHLDSINTLLKKIFAIDLKQDNEGIKEFYKFILLGELSYGAAAEIYYQFFWEVINVLTDDELSQYLQIIHFKYLSLKYLFFNNCLFMHEINRELYFQKFYPKSYKILMEE